MKHIHFSRILRAGTSIVLALLLVFGTVSTSLAAVVDNAETGRDTELAETGLHDSSTQKVIYIAIPTSWSSNTSSGNTHVWVNSDTSQNEDVSWTSLPSTVYSESGKDLYYAIVDSKYDRFGFTIWSTWFGDYTYANNNIGYMYNDNGNKISVGNIKPDSTPSFGNTTGTISTSESINLNPDITNPDFNYINDITYEVEKDGVSVNSGYTITDEEGTATFSASSAGTYTITGTFKVTAQGYGTSDSTHTQTLATTPTATITVTGTGCAPSFASASKDILIGQTATPQTASHGAGCAGGGSFTYSSSNTGVATVNASTGAVTAVGVGSTTITATCSTNSATASYTLNVYAFYLNGLHNSNAASYWGSGANTIMFTKNNSTGNYEASIALNGTYNNSTDNGFKIYCSKGSGTYFGNQTNLTEGDSGYGTLTLYSNSGGNAGINATDNGTYKFEISGTITSGDDNEHFDVKVYYPHTVTFNSNGGSVVSSVVVDYGNTVNAPADPAKTGYRFTGWQLNSADYSFSTAVTADITLDATWEAYTAGIALDSYYGETTASYSSGTTGGHVTDGSDATITSISGVHIDNAATVKAVAAAAAGYEFVGWEKDTSVTNSTHVKIYTDAACETEYTSGATTPVYIKTDGTSGMTTANAKVKALFVKKTYTVTYALNAGDPAHSITGSLPADATKIHGTALALAGNTGSLARLGYTLSGWTDNTTTYALDGTIAAGTNADITLYPVWTPAATTVLPAGTTFYLESDDTTNFFKGENNDTTGRPYFYFATSAAGANESSAITGGVSYGLTGNGYYANMPAGQSYTYVRVKSQVNSSIDSGWIPISSIDTTTITYSGGKFTAIGLPTDSDFLFTAGYGDIYFDNTNLDWTINASNKLYFVLGDGTTDMMVEMSKVLNTQQLYFAAYNDDISATLASGYKYVYFALASSASTSNISKKTTKACMYNLARDSKNKSFIGEKIATVNNTEYSLDLLWIRDSAIDGNGLIDSSNDYPAPANEGRYLNRKVHFEIDGRATASITGSKITTVGTTGVAAQAATTGTTSVYGSNYTADVYYARSTVVSVSGITPANGYTVSSVTATIGSGESITNLTVTANNGILSGQRKSQPHPRSSRRQINGSVRVRWIC